MAYGVSKQDVNCYSLYIAVNWAALGICYNFGQDCTAGSRVYVQETIYDKFSISSSRRSKRKLLEMAPEGGPSTRRFLLHRSENFVLIKVLGQYERVWGYIDSGKQKGAQPILGGVKRPGKGFYVDPTSACLKFVVKVLIHKPFFSWFLLIFGQA